MQRYMRKYSGGSDGEPEPPIRIQAMPLHRDPKASGSLFDGEMVQETATSMNDAIWEESGDAIDQTASVKPSDIRKNKNRLLSQQHVAAAIQEDEKKEDENEKASSDTSVNGTVDVLATGVARERDEDMMESFFELFARANDGGWTTQTTLELKDWLRTDSSLAQITDADGDMPLHWACECAADAEAVLSLLEALPEAVHVVNRRGWTALHVAVFHGASAEVVLILLDIYPEAPSIQDSENGFTLLHYTMFSRAPPGKQAMEPSEDDDTAYASALDNMSTVSGGNALFFRSEMKFVSVGVILAILTACPRMAKVTDNRGNLALHLGMIGGAPVVVIKAILGEYPGGARAANRQGKLPLHCALEHGAPVDAVLAVLEKYPEAAAALDKDRTTPLLYGLKHYAPTESILAVLEESPEAARITDREGRFPFECGVTSRAPSEVMRTLRVAYPDAAKVEPSSTPLHECLKSSQPEADVQYVLEVWPETASWTDDNGTFALGAWTEKLYGNDASGRSFRPRDSSGRNIFEAIYDAYPAAAEISSPVCPSPIDQLTRVCTEEDRFDELIHKDVVGFLQLMLKSSVEVKHLKRLCRTDNPVALQAFFGLFVEASPDENREDMKTPCINLNRKTILGGTPLEILADLDTQASSDILLQIVKKQKALLSTPYQTIVIDLYGPSQGESSVAFCSTDAVLDAVLVKVARRCMQSIRSQDARKWGEQCGRFFKKYRIAAGTFPKYISETSVVVFGTETRQDGQGRAFEARVAFKFMTDKDSFWKELKIRAALEGVESEQSSSDCNVARVIEGFTTQTAADAEMDRSASISEERILKQSRDEEPNATSTIKIGHTCVQCGIDLRDELTPYKRIRLSTADPNKKLDLDHLLVLECSSSLDANDVIVQRDIAGKNLEDVLHIATSVALILYQLNDKCQITHGDAKDRNFVYDDDSGGYVAIDLDCATRHGVVVGQKLSSSGYLPPEQARIEYYTQKLKSQDLEEEIITAREEVDGLKKKIQEALQSDEEATVDRLTTELRVAKRRVKELEAAPEEPPSVQASNKYDMWGFGCILYKLCTGRQIFDMDTREQVKNEGLREITRWDDTALQRKLKSIPSGAGWRALCRILFHLLQADPAKRPSSWLDILDMLERVDHDLFETESCEFQTLATNERLLLHKPFNSDQGATGPSRRDFNVLRNVAGSMQNTLAQLENMHCPFLFRFIEEHEFRRLVREKRASKDNTEDVRFEFEAVLRRCEQVLNPSSDISAKAREVLEARTSCMGKKWRKFRRKKGEILYLQLLCGWTFEPVVSYEIELNKHLVEVEQMASAGARLCAIGIKVAFMWEVGKDTAKIFGFPVSKIPEDLVERAVSLLKDIDYRIGIGYDTLLGGAIARELKTFGGMLDELERKGKMRQLHDQVDEKSVRGSWKEALRKVVVGQSGMATPKQMTYISAREGDKLAYSLEDIERAANMPL